MLTRCTRGLAASLLIGTLGLPLIHEAKAVDLLAEDFEGVTLMPVVTFESELRERQAWQTVGPNGPAGWTELNLTTSVGDSESGVLEFEGWRFVDKQWWIDTAGNQDRAQFLNGNGIIAVADPDEWDDFGNPDQGSESDLLPQNGVFDSTLITPSVAIGGVSEPVKLAFQSSWRPEDVQTATLTAVYNTGAPENLHTWTSDTADVNFKDDATNESLVYELQSIPAGATSVQFEFRLQGNNDWWWAIDNVRVFTGDNPGADGVLRAIIDRGTGEVKIVNQTGLPVDLRGYSIRSTAGAFDEAAATFLSQGDPNWLQATQVGGTANDLSEVHLTSDTLAADGEILLGSNVWLGYFQENADISFNYLVDGSDDQVVGIVEFTGSPGTPYQLLDLNFDGAIDILDWDAFKVGYGTDLTGLTQAVRYSLGDLDFNGSHSLADYVEFQRLFEQNFGAGSFVAMLSTSSVPEPATALWWSIAGVAMLVQRCRSTRHRWLPWCLLVALCSATMQSADAQLTLLFEDFEDVVLGPSVDEGGPEESGGVAASGVWSEAPPVSPVNGGVAPWIIDDSGVPISGDPDINGNPSNNGITEWAGWATANKDWWVETAGDQDRSQFTRGTGNVFIADPDEWEDGPTDPGENPPFDLYDAKARTPVINIPAGIPAGRIKLSFDSSWRPEGLDDGRVNNSNNQTAVIRTIYDDGVPSEVLRWDSDDEGDFFKPNATNERVSIDLDYDGTASTLQLEFALERAWNDWWWAMDNVLVSVPTDPVALRINTATGQAYVAGQDVIPSSLTAIDIFSPSGQLDINTIGGLSNSLSESADGPVDADAIPGNSPGEQWELLSSTSRQFAEAFLYGSSSFDSSRSEALGRLLSGLDPDPAVALQNSDLVFTYSLATGDIVEGIVEYFFEEAPALPGDFNLDGVVNLGDYTVWRDNLGAPADGGLNGNGDNLGAVTQGDYLVWKQNFGASAAALQTLGGTTAAVPEPASAFLGLLGGALVAARRVRRCTLAAFAAAMALVVGTAHAADPPSPFLDRDYQFGDDDAGAVVGQPVAQQDGNGNFFTRDSAGEFGMNQRIGLAVIGRANPTPVLPTYVDTTDRPDGNGGIGIRLNALPFHRQYLRTGFGEALNYPEQSPSSSASLVSPGGTLNYFRINDRGFEIWAKPTSVAGEQHIVMDSMQHGVLIDADGNFAMRYASRFEVETTQLPGPDGTLGTEDDILEVSDPVVTPANYATDVAAVANQWYHLSVVRPFGPGQGSIFYVNGIAETIAFGEYAVETIVNVGEGNVFTNIDSLDTSPLYVGARTDPLTLDRNLASQNPAEDFYFKGIVDDLRMFVIGLNDNDNLPGGGNNVLNDYGEYIFQRDNGYAQAFAPITDGDLDGDNSVTLADAGLFASNWLFENRLSAINPFTDEEASRLVGDLSTRALGDFDYNGIVDLEDWAILNNANPAAGAFAFQLISGAAVPEPSTVVLISLSAAAFWRLRRRRQGRGFDRI